MSRKFSKGDIVKVIAGKKIGQIGVILEKKYSSCDYQFDQFLVLLDGKVIERNRQDLAYMSSTA
jgi:transcription elongation factor